MGDFQSSLTQFTTKVRELRQTASALTPPVVDPLLRREERSRKFRSSVEALSLKEEWEPSYEYRSEHFSDQRRGSRGRGNLSRKPGYEDRGHH